MNVHLGIVQMGWLSTVCLLLMLLLSPQAIGADKADTVDKADKPREGVDLDAELTKALQAWLAKVEAVGADATPGDAERAAHDEALKKEAAALLRTRTPMRLFNSYRGDDKLKRAAATGRTLAHQGFYEVVELKYDTMIKRISADPKLRVARASDVMLHAARKRRYDDIRLLIKRGADPNVPTTGSGSRRPLHLAADLRGGPELIEFLLKHGADPNLGNVRESRPLHWIWATRSAELLLEHGAKPSVTDKDGNTPLHTQALYAGYAQDRNKPGGGSDIVNLLLKHRADVHATNKDGMTPLHKTASANVAHALIQHGAKGDARDKAGNTPLHLARTVEVARVLLKAGVDPDITNHAGDTPLHLAKDGSIVSALVGHGANVNAVNKTGNTPLHVAEHKDVIAALLKHDAKLEIANKQGRRAGDRLLVKRMVAFIKETGVAPTVIWARVSRKLEDPLPMGFDQNKFVNVIDFFRNVIGVNIYVDWNHSNLDMDTRITFKTEKPVPADEAITAILNKVGGKDKVAWQVDADGIVIIAEPKRLKSLLASQGDELSPDQRDIPDDLRTRLFRLEEPIPVQFEQNRLKNVVTYFNNVSGTKLRVDWKALEAVGVSRDTYVTLHLRNSRFLRTVELTFQVAAGDQAKVEIHDGYVCISTPKGMRAFLKGGG